MHDLRGLIDPGYARQPKAELAYLREHIQLYADPAALDYLRRTVGEFLPPETMQAGADEARITDA